MAEVILNRNFFVEDTGKAVVGGTNGKVGYIHLQNASFEFSSKMENIEGGESNTPLYSYQTEKDGKVTFQNTSMDAQSVAMTQGQRMRGCTFRIRTARSPRNTLTSPCWLPTLTRLKTTLSAWMLWMVCPPMLRRKTPI